MSIIKKLEIFQKINGYLGSGVFTSDGKMLGGITEVMGINFEIAGTLFHDSFLITNNNSQEAGFGKVEMFHLYTEKGIIVGKCFNEEGIHFHTILVVEPTANLGMAKLLLSKAIDDLKSEFY